MPLERQPGVNDLLRTAQGQLRRIVQMTESGEPCQGIMRQIAALQVALRVLSRQLVRREAQMCLEQLQNEPCQEQQREIVDQLVALYQL